MAPDLIGWASDTDFEHCIWKKQPQTVEELEQAFAAFDASCIDAYRYAGSDPAIISRLGPNRCDQRVHCPPEETQVTSESSPESLAFTLLEPTGIVQVVTSWFKRRQK